MVVDDVEFGSAEVVLDTVEVEACLSEDGEMVRGESCWFVRLS